MCFALLILSKLQFVNEVDSNGGRGLKNLRCFYRWELIANFAYQSGDIYEVKIYNKVYSHVDDGRSEHCQWPCSSQCRAGVGNREECVVDGGLYAVDTVFQ